MSSSHDVVVLGGTPGGITAAVAAARRGHEVALLVRGNHVGGLPANGLGATDINTRGATGGLFDTFVERVREHYVETYGPDSPQVADCDGGYHFEPSVAETVFEDMLGEHPIDVRRDLEFAAEPGNVEMGADGRTVAATDRGTGETERYGGEVLIDATYEGDLAAAAGAPFRIGREPADEFDEPLAGKVYKEWAGPTGAGSTGEGDNAIQAYNYRLCLTRDDDNKRPIEKPANYDRAEYVSLIGDVTEGRTTDARGHVPEGMDRVVNMVDLPNDKVDANNQHAAFVSTDLPEENWPWPTSFPAWRERFAERLREYTLGLLWFAGHDPELPEAFKERVREWGLAADEYADNGGFPRQVYVREGRRVEGEYLFTAHDALPEDGRPPLHRTSVTASHYSLDSHAVRKREPGRVHLDGFLNTSTEPYTVPYGVIVPREPEGLLTPVPVSGTHVGFSTLRMEPCWMALGEAAGTAAALSVEREVEPRDVPVPTLQRALLDAGATLVYYEDADPDHPAYPALGFLGVRGFVPGWEADLDDAVDAETAGDWIAWAGADLEREPGETRGSLLRRLYDAIEGLAPDRVAEVGPPD